MKKLFFLFLFLWSFPAAADVITRADVEAHLRAEVDLYNVPKVDRNAIFEFVKNYVVPEGMYRANYYINDSEEPKVVSMNGKQTLKKIKEENYEYAAASARYEIIDYQQNVGEENALVRYKLWHNGKTRYENESEIAFVSFDSVADCTESFGLVDGKVKGLKNICDVIVKQEEPVRVRKGSE